MNTFPVPEPKFVTFRTSRNESKFRNFSLLESWVVKTLKGFVAPEFQMTLHVTRHALSLVTMNPPKCRKRWELTRISDYWSREGIFYFKVDVASSAEAGKWQGTV